MWPLASFREALALPLSAVRVPLSPSSVSDSYSDLYLSQHGDVVFFRLSATKSFYLSPTRPLAPEQHFFSSGRGCVKTLLTSSGSTTFPGSKGRNISKSYIHFVMTDKKEQSSKLMPKKDLDIVIFSVGHAPKLLNPTHPIMQLDSISSLHRLLLVIAHFCQSFHHRFVVGSPGWPRG